MGIITRQRRLTRVGKIRLGIKVPTRNGGTRPERLKTFRFTGSQHAIEAVAAQYGGTARPWEGSRGEWEVITDATRIQVTIPPGDQVVSQWFELWTKAGCSRRCDGVTEQISQGPCPCPPDGPERAQAAADGKACKPMTRLSVILPDIPGLGVWMLSSTGWNAANDLGNIAEFLAAVRDRAGVYIPAYLRLDEREARVDGKTSVFAVPVLEPLHTLREITAMEPGVMAGLPPAPADARAITAAPSAAASVPAQAAVTAAPAPAGDEDVVDAEIEDDEPDPRRVNDPGTPPAGVTVPDCPDAVALALPGVKDDPAAVRWLWLHARNCRWLDEWVPRDGDPDGDVVILGDLIDEYGKAAAARAGGAR